MNRGVLINFPIFLSYIVRKIYAFFLYITKQTIYYMEYKCRYCGKEIKTEKGLKLHIRSCKYNPDGIPIVMSEERKQRISNALKGKPLTEKQKIARPKHLSETHKMHLRESSLNALITSRCPYCDNEFRKLENHILYCENNPNRIEAPSTGHFVSDEIKLKSSIIHKNKHLTDEHKQKIKEHSGGWHHSDETKQRISETHKGKTTWSKGKKMSQDCINKKIETYKNKTDDEKLKIKQKIKNTLNSPETKQKIYNTKKQNNTFHTSKIETELKNYFDSNNIEYISQYKSELYPFCCDFYFPDKDLYVEIQGCWTHGGKPFDAGDEECIKQLEIWKSKNTKFYNNAIKTWTVRDVNKRNIAKQNNLNWVEIFSNDLNECLKIIFNN